MKYFLLTLIISLFGLNSYSQSDCSITEEYGNIFKVEKMNYGERVYLHQTINTLDSNACFSDLVNNNTAYINYLRQHFVSTLNYEELLALNDDEQLQDSYISTLENDQEFNELMSKLAYRVSKADQLVQDTITLDQMLNIAIKYFSIIGVTEEGHFKGKVCTGINGIKETEEIRQAQLEAFCFSAILNNLKNDQSNLYNEFVKGIKELYKINLGLKEEERILRAQGAMYMFMRNNQVLRELLITEFQQKKKYLPFVLNVN